MKRCLKFLFIICTALCLSCTSLKPVPKESVFKGNNNSNNNVSSYNGVSRNYPPQGQGTYKGSFQVRDNQVKNVQVSNNQILTNSNQISNNQEFNNTQEFNNQSLSSDNNKRFDINDNENSKINSNSLQKLKNVARENKKEYFRDSNLGNISPSIPKGIFTVRNTNFVTIGEKGDIWLWSSNLQNRTHIENLGTCVDKVDLDHNTLAIFWSCGAKLFTKELLNPESTKYIDRIKTRASAFTVYTNSTQFLVGGADGKLYRWDNPLKINITDFSKFERYTAHSTVVSAVAFHPAGRVFFSGDWQGRFKAWLSYKEDEFGGEYDENLFGGRFFEDGSTVKDSGRSGGSIEKIVVSPDGNHVLLGFQDSTIEIWKLRSFKKVLEFKASDLRLLDVKFATNNLFITLSKDNKVKYWKFEENLDDLGNYVYKESLIDEKEFELPNLLYVTGDGRVLLANEKGNLINIE